MMNRRDFLLGAASAVALPGASGDLYTLAHPTLLAVLGTDAVHAIGQAYRARVPTERERGRLAALVRAGHVQSDFVAGRTVVIHGWVLSVTEARQCALFSLANVA
ncbi:MAG TPA: hypothetical protein VL549_04445 [Gemmatimonadales bacterium]|jgi:hypothetical protein|nr:hypothetical protein [Gemmatimonadales bacterium]